MDILPIEVTNALFQENSFKSLWICG